MEVHSATRVQILNEVVCILHSTNTLALMCIWMYVCMYKYIYVCMYVWIYMYVCMYEYIYVCMYVCMNIYMYVCMYEYVCMYVCMLQHLPNMDLANLAGLFVRRVSRGLMEGDIQPHSSTCLNSEFSFSKIGCYAIVKEHGLPYSLIIAGGRTVGFICFLSV